MNTVNDRKVHQIKDGSYVCIMAVRYGKFTGIPKIRTETKCTEWQSKGEKQIQIE